MRDADELHERIARCDCVDKCRSVERVPANGDRARRQFVLRSIAYERAHGVSATDELRDEALPDVAGAAGDEDVAHVCRNEYARETRSDYRRPVEDRRPRLSPLPDRRGRLSSTGIAYETRAPRHRPPRLRMPRRNDPAPAPARPIAVAA